MWTKRAFQKHCRGDSNQKVILNSTLLKFWRLMIFVEDRMKLLSDSSDEEIAKIKI